MAWCFGAEGIRISLGYFSQKCPVIYSLKDSKKPSVTEGEGGGEGWFGKKWIVLQPTFSDNTNAVAELGNTHKHEHLKGFSF